jgi:RNA polymerase sigma-70 factor (ECF subfamily)
MPAATEVKYAETPAGRPGWELDDFELVARTWWPAVFRYALSSLRDPDAAATLAQDCLLKAWRSRQSFRGDSSLRTWLMQIAVNLVRDYGRNRRLQFWKNLRNAPSSVEAAAESLAGRDLSPEARAAIHQQVTAVWAVTATLPERQRTVFLLRFVEEMDLLEIAAATGMAEGTVKAHLFRALRTVRERMEKKQ